VLWWWWDDVLVLESALVEVEKEETIEAGEGSVVEIVVTAVSELDDGAIDVDDDDNCEALEEAVIVVEGAVVAVALVVVEALTDCCCCTDVCSCGTTWS